MTAPTAKPKLGTLTDLVAQAIWARRPDCIGKAWPIKTMADVRAYPHNPIAAVDLCYAYAEVAIDIILSEGWDDDQG